MKACMNAESFLASRGTAAASLSSLSRNHGSSDMTTPAVGILYPSLTDTSSKREDRCERPGYPTFGRGRWKACRTATDLLGGDALFIALLSHAPVCAHAVRVSHYGGSSLLRVWIAAPTAAASLPRRDSAHDTYGSRT